MTSTWGRALAIALGMAVALSGCSRSADGPAPAPTAPSATGTPTPSPRAPKERATDPLTGQRLSPNEVFAVKIENTAAARPQIGVGAADIVVVQEVESQITRLVAVFHTRFPTRVGPVRSARNTDARLLPLFGRPGLVYSGANAKVQANLRKASLVPIERSDRDGGRPAPHNVVVDLARLARQESVGKAKPIGLEFAAGDSRWAKAEAARSVAVKVGGDTTGFRYTGGSYAVSWNGKPNVDANTGKPVRTDNVVVLRVRNRHDDDSTSRISVVSETVGSGKVTVYRDGRTRAGRWERRAVDAPLRLLDRDGADIPLRPGKSWVLLRG